MNPSFWNQYDKLFACYKEKKYTDLILHFEILLQMWLLLIHLRICFYKMANKNYNLVVNKILICQYNPSNLIIITVLR